MKFRKEFDSIGSINVPNDKYWGASTQRSKKFFNIGKILVPSSIIRSIAIIKRCAAIVHQKDKLICGILLISHDLHTVMSATDHVVCLNGHVCCSGSPIDVAKNNEYKALFGDQASQILTRYEHKHDHVHSSDGSIKQKN